MQYRKLGNTGVDVSLLSYGTGGPSQFGQKTGVDDAGRAALIGRALELGVNLFDTAEGYGEAEGMLGRALQGHARDSYLVATKWSYRKPDGLVTDPDVIIGSLEQSLERLNTVYIDIFQIHGVTPEHYDSVADIYIPVMQRLQEQGKTRFLGVTEMLTMDPKHDGMSVSMERHPDVWDSVMLKYGIMNQWASKRALPLAKSSSTGVLNMAPVRLTLTRPEKLNERMTEWGQNGGANALDWLSGGDSAELIRKGYQFAAEPAEVTTVISGTSSIAHLEANIAALEGALAEVEVERLKSAFTDSASPD
ncbi:MAG: aldo/keto reductase [Chloroflexi bacterium]|nr:aldo/keto reductase [Chloroflexota bacterium]